MTGGGRDISKYDVAMTLVEPVLRPGRKWVCRRASGSTLEVAIGTGLNLAHYQAGVSVTGIELDPRLAKHARRRAARLNLPLRMVVGDAMRLPFEDNSFDSVVCTFALCGIERDDVALTEMIRVLKPDGNLLLADHVRARARPVRAIQRLMDAITLPLAGEHWTRRPLETLKTMGIDVVATHSSAFGILEQTHARIR